ncbi:hypothetical protein AAMO2058_001180800 [Amorphochlora amoebiformis]
MKLMTILLLSLSSLALAYENATVSRGNWTTGNMSLHEMVISVGRAGYMDCGEGVPLCGVMVLESGFGPRAYHHNEPCVHGLWPETGSYGSSDCVKPTSSDADPEDVAPCYDDLGFEIHEWEKHGECAGVRDSDDFFAQLCSLSETPLEAMQDVKDQGGSVDDMARALKEQGFPVYYVDTRDSQVYISACAASDGRWKIADVDNFAASCT